MSILFLLERVDIEGKNKDSRARLAGFKTKLCCLLVVRSWASHLASASLFSHLRRGNITVPPSGVAGLTGSKLLHEDKLGLLRQPSKPGQME